MGTAPGLVVGEQVGFTVQGPLRIGLGRATNTVEW